ncbi:hypothetical protein JX265_004690 [Neoarthrinium moseri]|uniref:DUF7730 domain-containing protein n=1 Tax=Neoarthrinium moseri TaxID=1658444 RepID=A0A9Q0AQR0_9PEZI|nr:uncharacterized protein JN550_003808 [Neoarthrinium moseri]KAI1841580.1 hypothetical protein JX266_012233 [Neoarthrinium moseri]KAI1872934.1 hypothetical protein JN550_003808 [Neoarthrinium moseri]KAI1874482.1 hypothetical protein JX265_004690 [Neoarthrinium moseri]
MDDGSHLMRAPAEVRMLIYEYIFDDAGTSRLLIRSADAGKVPSTTGRLRKRYHVLDRSMQRRCYQTTYRLASEGVHFCAALMRVNSKIYEETSHLVYARHAFDFGSDIEAVEPFLSDLRPSSRYLIQEISLYKRGPIPLYENDRSEWRSVCRFLQSNGAIKKLRLVIQGGRPSVQWEGPKEFTASDFKFLADIKHESLDWVNELAQVKGIEELEVLPDVHYCPPPTSTSMLVFAAFSASIEKGLAEFLKSQLRLI